MATPRGEFGHANSWSEQHTAISSADHAPAKTTSGGRLLVVETLADGRPVSWVDGRRMSVNAEHAGADAGGDWTLLTSPASPFGRKVRVAAAVQQRVALRQIDLGLRRVRARQ